MQKKYSEPVAAAASDPIKSPSWLCDDIGISLVTFWRYRRAGHYPPLVEVGPGRCGQFLSVHEAWKRARPHKSAPVPAPQPAAA